MAEERCSAAVARTIATSTLGAGSSRSPKRATKSRAKPRRMAAGMDQDGSRLDGMSAVCGREERVSNEAVEFTDSNDWRIIRPGDGVTQPRKYAATGGRKWTALNSPNAQNRSKSRRGVGPPDRLRIAFAQLVDHQSLRNDSFKRRDLPSNKGRNFNNATWRGGVGNFVQISAAVLVFCRAFLAAIFRSFRLIQEADPHRNCGCGKDYPEADQNQNCEKLPHFRSDTRTIRGRSRTNIPFDRDREGAMDGNIPRDDPSKKFSKIILCARLTI